MIKHLDCRYLISITDEIGVWQHAEKEGVFVEHGYALDDSARGLIAALQYGELAVASRALGFLERVYSREGVINFIDAKGVAVDHPTSPDAIGETIWALGECVKYQFEPERVAALLPTVELHVGTFDGHLRSHAYAALGYLQISPERALAMMKPLYAAYQAEATTDWHWLEPRLTYANALLPLAFLEVGSRLGLRQWQLAGESMLTFLNALTTQGDIPVAIGNRGWHAKGGTPALFDQQPIDPAYQVLANVAAARITRRSEYKHAAKQYLSWFWGNNLKGLSLIDESDGSCRDGLSEDGVSSNRGSENIVCYLMAQHAYESMMSSEEVVI